MINAFLNLFLFICVVWNQVAVLSTIKAVPSNRNCHSLLKARLFYMFLIVGRQMCEIVLILQTFLLNPLSAAPRTLLNLWVNSHSPMGKPSLSLCFHSLVFQRPMILLYLPQLKMCFLIPKRKRGVLLKVLSRERDFSNACPSSSGPRSNGRNILPEFTSRNPGVYWTSLQNIGRRLLTGMWLLLPERSHLENLYPEGMRAPSY